MDNLAYDSSFYRDNREKRELLDGKIYMMSGPSMNHLEVSGRIYMEFKRYLRGKPCKVYAEGANVHLSDKDHVQPDVTVICDRSRIKAGMIVGAPDLIVEVLSPSTEKRDIGYKMALYAKHGVKEYWVVSTTDKSVKVYLNDNGVYDLADIYRIYPDYELEAMTDEEKSALVTEFSPFLFPDMKITLDEVFEDMLE